MIHVAAQVPAGSPTSLPSVHSRRDALRLLGFGTLAAGAGPARAFENAVPEYANYADKPKRPGTAPKDLGLAKRTINADSIDADPVTFEGLRGCDGKPNCFSTTGDELLEDRPSPANHAIFTVLEAGGSLFQTFY